MGKAQFTKTVSAFEHAMPGSAQEKIHQRSDLEAMVEQLEQSSLEEDGQALVQVLQRVRALGTTLSEDPVAEQLGSGLKEVREEIKQGSLQAQAASQAVVNQAVSAMDTAEESNSLRAFVCADNASEVRDAEVRFGVDAGALQGEDGNARSVRNLLQELQERTEGVATGGESPCHFSTLTTAIYHWQDLAAILEKYEVAARQLRGGRKDPMEPSERRFDRHPSQSSAISRSGGLVYSVQDGVVLQICFAVRRWACSF